MNMINNLILEELSQDTKHKLKKFGIGLGLAALAGGTAYAAHKYNQKQMRDENESINNAKKGWNIAHHLVNTKIIYDKTPGFLGKKIKSIPASLYLAKNLKNEKNRNKESVMQQGMNHIVDKLSGVDKLNMFNHKKINRKRLLLTHAANALYAGTKLGTHHLIQNDILNKHIAHLGSKTLGHVLNSI